MNNYWANRIQKNQEIIEGKTIQSINQQLQKYYVRASERVIADFDATYNKILKSVEGGREPTPADLYKLDRYWKAQGIMQKELNALGNKTINTLLSNFIKHYYSIYNSIALPGEPIFEPVNRDVVIQLINQIWVADGKQWSQRVWDNTSRLAETLNEELIHIVATGKQRDELEKILMNRFDVSFRRAQTLVRTEVAHIQIEASRRRYEDYGIEYVEVLTADDGHVCPLCQELNGKRFKTNQTPPLPVHPNERCCLIPVVN